MTERFPQIKTTRIESSVSTEVAIAKLKEALQAQGIDEDSQNQILAKFITNIEGDRQTIEIPEELELQLVSSLETSEFLIPEGVEYEFHEIEEESTFTLIIRFRSPQECVHPSLCPPPLPPRPRRPPLRERFPTFGSRREISTLLEALERTQHWSGNPPPPTP